MVRAMKEKTWKRLIAVLITAIMVMSSGLSVWAMGEEEIYQDNTVFIEDNDGDSGSDSEEPDAYLWERSDCIGSWVEANQISDNDTYQEGVFHQDLTIHVSHHSEWTETPHSSTGQIIIFNYINPISDNVDDVSLNGVSGEFNADRTKIRFLIDNTYHLNSGEEISMEFSMDFYGTFTDHEPYEYDPYGLITYDVAVNDEPFRIDMDGNPIPVATRYAIQIEQTPGGTVTADRDVAKMDDYITLTIMPDDGKVLRQIVLNDGALTATPSAYGTYSFRMPDSDVTIQPEWIDSDSIVVGDGVTASIVSVEGGKAIYFNSENGTLYNNWKETFSPLGIDIFTEIKAIGFLPESGIMYLPEDSSSLFSNFHNLGEIDLSKADTSNVTAMSGMFENCSNLANLDLSRFQTTNVINMSRMFGNCRSLTDLNLINFNTENVTDMSFMFGQCSGLTRLDQFNFHTENVINMSSMFSGCTQLVELNLNSFNTENVTNMSFMFSGCSQLETLNLLNLNTKNVTDMSFMFGFCNSLRNLNLGNFDTGHVTNMSNMFGGCSQLEELSLNSFNTENVTSMSNMFAGLQKLEVLDLRNFSTENVTDMYGMFNYSTGLKELDLSSFDTSSVTWFSQMLAGCNSLETLYTPGNNSCEIELPIVMYDGSGNEYSALPVLSESIILTNTTTLPKLSIIRQPVSCKQIAGAKVHFSLEAEGEGLTYQWQFRKPGSSTWNDAGYYNAKTENLTFVQTEGRSKNTYRCVVTDAYGRVVESDEVSAVLATGPVIVKQPVSVKALLDTAVSFAIEVEGEGLTYQWQFQKPGKTTWANSGLASAKKAILKFKTAEKDADKKFRCIVTDADGFSVISEEATLTIVDSPAITKQPEDLEAALGDVVYFNITATGNGLTYQWQYQAPGKTTWTNSSLAGNKTAKLRVAATAGRNGGKYRCVVVDEEGVVAISYSAILTVR